MAEELRLEASVVDKFSKPLRDLRNRLQDVKTPDHVKGMSGDFKKLEGSITSATKSIRDGLGQAMTGLSIPSLTAVASIGGIVAAVKNFSAGTIELRQFQRETGLTAGALKALQHSASQFGISDDAIAPGLKNFSNNLHDFKRQYGDTYGFLLEHSRGFAEKLRADSPAKALEDSLKYLEQLAQQRDPRTAGIIAEKLFGSDVFARFGLRGRQSISDLIKEMRKAKGPSADDEDAATAFDKNVEKLRESFKGLGKTVGADLTPVLGQAVGFIDKFIEANKERIGTNLQEAATGIGKALSATNWQETSTSISVIRQSFEAMVGPIKTIGAFLDKIPGINWSTQDEADMGVRGGRFIERFLSGKKFGASEELADARKALAQYDKDHHYNGAAGMRGAANDMVRHGIVSEIERLEKATEAGTEKGITNFFQKQSLSGSGAAGDGMRPIMASYGGSGGIADHPAVRAIRRAFGQGDSGDVEDTGAGRGRGGMPQLSKNQSEAAMRYMDRLVKIHGFTPEAAAIAAGNVGNESGWKSGIGGDGGISHGLHQWNRERFAALKKFAAGRGKAWTDFDTQTDFAALEMQKKIPWTKSQHDFSHAGRWGHLYEGYSTATEGARVASGQRYYRMWQHHRPADMGPAPGSLLGRNVQPGLKSREGTAVLHIKLDGNAKATRADGGTLFHEMHVNRGRSMVAAQET